MWVCWNSSETENRKQVHKLSPGQSICFICLDHSRWHFLGQCLDNGLEAPFWAPPQKPELIYAFWLLSLWAALYPMGLFTLKDYCFLSCHFKGLKKFHAIKLPSSWPKFNHQFVSDTFSQKSTETDKCMTEPRSCSMGPRGLSAVWHGCSCCATELVSLRPSSYQTTRCP